MATTKLGNTDVVINAPTIAGYVVQSVTDPAGADIDMEDIIDHTTGQRVTRIVYQVDQKINLSLITTTGTPETDFAIGTIKEILSNDYFIDDLQIQKTRGAQQVTVSATNIGIAAPA